MDSLTRSLEKALRRAKVLSLDIFDTAISRRLDLPSDLFALLAIEARALAPLPDLASQRQSAESRARDQAWRERGASEIGLDEIYRELGRATGLDDSLLGRLQTLELELELRVCTANPAVADLYAEARLRELKVVFTSDTYLPRPFVERLLSQAGYAFDALFVSSEHLKTKAHKGQLFSTLLAELRVKAGEVLHIGDNPVSDGRNADLWEIPHRIIAQNRDAFTHAPHTSATSAHQTLFGKIRAGLNHLVDAELSGSALPEPDKFWYGVGYRIAGPVLLAFTSAISRTISEKAPDLTCFLSRDGLSLMRIHRLLSGTDPAMGLSDPAVLDLPLKDLEANFDRIAITLRQPPAPSTRDVYLLASRRSLNFAAMEQLDAESIDFLQSGPPHQPIGSFLERIDLAPSCPDVAAALSKFGFQSPADRVSTGEDYARLRKLFAELEPLIMTHVARERKDYLAYLDTLGLGSVSKLLVVDIGWHGSLQRSLGRLLRKKKPGADPDSRVDGVYFGTYSGAGRCQHPGDSAQGFFFHEGLPPERLRLVKISVELIELLFLNATPTFLRVRQETDLLEFAYAPTGTPFRSPAHPDLINLGALRFARDYLRMAPHLMPTPDDAGEVISELLQHPTRTTLQHLANLSFTDGFGVSRPRRLLPSAPSVIRWRQTASDYRGSLWRAAYLKNLTPLERQFIHLICPSSRQLWREIEQFSSDR